MITVYEMIKSYLKEHGYDGLCCDECGCHINDLMPCGGDYVTDCVAGYNVSKSDDPFSYYISPEKQEASNGQ